MYATVSELKRRCVDIGLFTSEEFCKCIPANHPNDDVEGALALLKGQERSGTRVFYPHPTLLSDYQIADLRENSGVNLRCKDWVILRQLGQGGMGVVFLARDLRTDSQAALKVETRTNPTPGRFRTEYSTLANFRHDGLPRYRESGKWNGDTNAKYSGRPFYVMDYIRGRSFKEYADGNIDFAHAVRLMREVAEVLGYCHDLRVLHRDIKLKNLVVEASTDRAFVLDLGLCKHIRVHQEASVVAGSLHNMAPEQFTLGAILCPATDIYGLGTAFFELLTGHSPFDGDSKELKHKHQHEDPPSVCSFRQDCPKWLCDLIARMLSKVASDRPTNGKDVAGELLAGPETITIPHGSTSRTANEQQRLFDRFIKFASIGIDRVEVELAGDQDIEYAVRCMEGAFAALKEAAALGISPSCANLLSVGEFLKPMQLHLAREWPTALAGPVTDTFGKVYTFALVYLADWLTDECVASHSTLKLDLNSLRADVEDVLRCWATAVTGGPPYRSVLDGVLANSLQGRYSTPLPQALSKLSPTLLGEFNQAIRARLRSGRDDEHTLYQFIANQAIPFWRSRADLPAADMSQIGRLAGESLCALLDVIRLDTGLVLSAVPQAVKSLGLANNSLQRDAIHRSWSANLKRRLFDYLGELSRIAPSDPAFNQKFCEVMPHLRPAVDGQVRRSERIPLFEFSNQSQIFCELVGIDDPADSLQCKLTDISCDMLGIGITIPGPVEGDLPHTAPPDSQISQMLEEFEDYDSQFLIQLKPSLKYCRIGDCFMRLTTADGTGIELVGLDPRWWRPASGEANLSARFGLEIRHLRAGSIEAFINSMRDSHGVEVTPDERLGH